METETVATLLVMTSQYQTWSLARANTQETLVEWMDELILDGTPKPTF